MITNSECAISDAMASDIATFDPESCAHVITSVGKSSGGVGRISSRTPFARTKR